MEFVTLNNGVKMPKLGYGVYQTPQDITKRCVLDAISAGYRLIDTAQAYENEEGVGDAVKECGIDREELFITTKVWISNAGYDKAKKSIEESIEKLQTDYIDLLLIHQPFGDYYGTYRAMEEAYSEGRVKAIGVSNFMPDRLIDICKFVNIQPTVNQIETHVFHQQQEAHEYMEKLNVQHQSWGPFAEGKKGLFNNKVLKEIGKKYNKTTAQVALRYLLQNDVVVIPKTTHKERMIENFDVFDFVLDKKDMKAIAKLDEKDSAFFSHQDPKTVEWFMSRI